MFCFFADVLSFVIIHILVMTMPIIYIIFSLSVVVAVLFIYVYRHVACELSVFNNRIKPLELKLLTANIGNVNIRRAVHRFKLSDDETVVLKQNIEKLSPDIIFLQELASEKQVGMLVDHDHYLTHYSFDCCIAVRKGVFSRLINVETDPGSDGYMHCRALVAERGYELSLLNVHTTSFFSDPSFNKCGEQIKNMFNLIRKECDKSRRIIVAGDFNFDPYRFDRFSEKVAGTEKQSELKSLLEGLLYSKLKVLLEGWNKEFRELHPGGLRVVSTEKPTWCLGYKFSLDHVMTNLKTRNCSVLDSEDNRIDIDHEYELVSMPERFMDHRAVSAALLLDFDPDTLITLKKKILYMLAKRH